MAVGDTPLTCYQKEDVIWDFTVSDPNVATIAGWTIVLKIKAEADDLDPPLLTDNASITGTLVFRHELNINIPPGTYVYGVRRTDSGTSWELATATLTVLDTPSMDV